MSGRRHTPEQIIRKLAEGQKLLAGDMSVEDVCRQFGIAESTRARWLSQYGGMKADDDKRLKELEGENVRLKKLLVEAELEKAILKEVASDAPIDVPAGGGLGWMPIRRRLWSRVR